MGFVVVVEKITTSNTHRVNLNKYKNSDAKIKLELILTVWYILLAFWRRNDDEVDR